MAQKFREIVIRPDVTLPALSTDLPERPYTFLSFLQEWVVNAREMRKDENLPHLFLWEETLEAFTKKMAEKAGVTEPPVVGKVEMPEQPPPGATEAQAKEFLEKVMEVRKKVEAEVKARNTVMEEYNKALSDAAVGECIYVPDTAFLAAKSAAKAALDQASTPNQQGQTAMARLWESKVLRHYHAFSQSKAVDEKDVPSKPEKAVAATPN